MNIKKYDEQLIEWIKGKIKWIKYHIMEALEIESTEIKFMCTIVTSIMFDSTT